MHVVIHVRDGLRVSNDSCAHFCGRRRYERRQQSALSRTRPHYPAMQSTWASSCLPQTHHDSSAEEGMAISSMTSSCSSSTSYSPSSMYTAVSSAAGPSIPSVCSSGSVGGVLAGGGGRCERLYDSRRRGKAVADKRRSAGSSDDDENDNSSRALAEERLPPSLPRGRSALTWARWAHRPVETRVRSASQRLRGGAVGRARCAKTAGNWPTISPSSELPSAGTLTTSCSTARILCVAMGVSAGRRLHLRPSQGTHHRRSRPPAPRSMGG